MAPHDLYVYDGVAIASYKDAAARYLIDSLTGLDEPFTPKMTSAFELLITDEYNAYGSVAVSGGSVEYSCAKIVSWKRCRRVATGAATRLVSLQLIRGREPFICDVHPRLK